MKRVTGLMWATEAASCPLVASGPRQLVPIANEPVLFHALEALRASGVNEVVVVVSRQTEAPIREVLGDGRRFRLRTAYLRVDPPGAWSDVLRSAADLLGAGPCVVQHEEGLIRGDLRPHVEEIRRRPSDALVLVHRPVGGSRVEGMDGRRLLRLLDPSPSSGLAPTGVCLLGSEVLRRLRNTLIAGSDRSFCEALASGVSGRGQLEAREVPGWWRFTTRGSALLEANRMLLDDLESDWERATLRDCRVEGRVVAHPTAQLESSLIRGPALIGARARVRDSYIGPYTAIGDAVAVDGAEIESSMILSRAVIRHVGRRIEESIVGSGTKVYRDFALPTALRVRVGEDELISLPY
jgi:glucose-1-phosphate thymidylyltransferase